jgi:hypothetical protein
MVDRRYQTEILSQRARSKREREGAIYKRRREVRGRVRVRRERGRER